jgi:Flp pilus assembly protein TadD
LIVSLSMRMNRSFPNLGSRALFRDMIGAEPLAGTSKNKRRAKAHQRPTADFEQISAMIWQLAEVFCRFGRSGFLSRTFAPSEAAMADSIVQRMMQSGIDHYRAGRLNQAESIFRQVLRDEPSHAGARHLVGLIAQQTGRLPEAHEHMSKSIALNPENAGWYVNLGQVCVALRRYDDAAGHFLQGKKLDPAARVDGPLAKALVLAGRYAEGLAHIEAAMPRWPDDPELLAWLGVAVAESRGPEAGLIHLKRACELAPRGANFQAMLGKLLRDAGRLAESRVSHEQVFRLDPHFEAARLNYAIALLHVGEMPAGWDAWDARPAVALELPKARYQRPLWTGTSEPGASILLRAEQGFGDVIQFIRYAPLVAERGLKVFVECHRELQRLIRRVPAVEAVFEPGANLPDCRFHQLIMSLPRVFRTTLQTIPAKVPYLSVDAAMAGEWEARLGPRTGKVRVGLAWAGRPTHTNDKNRSLALIDLAPLAVAANAEFYQLQMGPAAGQARPAGLTLLDHTAHFLDFCATAGLISQLDLVISVDTALVHLAGAMAKPVWTLLPFVPDWRWLESRTDSPWYPTMRLFRQPRIGDWGAAIAAAADALVGVAQASGSA